METKAFYLSKTFWASVVSIIYAIMLYFDVNILPFDEAKAVEYVMVIVGIITLWGRKDASVPLGLKSK